MPLTDPFILALHEWIKVFFSKASRGLFHYSKQSGLSMSQLGALFQIHRMGSCGVTDLGEDLGVTSAAASQMLERLVQQGLILRTEDPADRRAKQLVLTEKGKQTVVESIQARQGWLEQLDNKLSSKEKEAIIAALNILIEKMKQIDIPVN
jgi:DNA-binding MarR family transcriptional regulator